MKVMVAASLKILSENRYSNRILSINRGNTVLRVAEALASRQQLRVLRGCSCPLIDICLGDTHDECQEELFSPFHASSSSSRSHPQLTGKFASAVIPGQIDKSAAWLIQESSYFRGLLTGSFSESCLDCVPIQWNLETVINVLKSIYGYSLNVTSNNFLPLLEGALFFGVEALLLECKTWLTKATSTKWLSSVQIELDIIIEIWNFGLDRAIGFIPELCTGYLARNFMWTVSCSSFADVPYNLLCHCVEHPNLTVDSEKCLAEALLVWIESNKVLLGCSSSDIEVDYTDILQKVSKRNLCFMFVGKRRNMYFAKLADESISAILNLIKDPSMRHALKDGAEYNNIRIRLTEYTEKIDLSGCPQITSASLLLSVLPYSYNMDPITRKKIKESFTDLENLDRNPYRISQLPTLSFEAVREVDISNCPQLHLEAAIECFCKSFPSLRKLNASYCLQFRMSTLFLLVQKCHLVNEVDLTADISPAMPTQVSTISTTIDGYHDSDAASYTMMKRRPLLSNITKLTLEGRSDINDLDLLNILAFSSSLSFLNLKGCTSVTDVGISKLICKCANLQSLNVSDTYFGRISVLVLISDFPSSDDFPGVCHGQKYSSSLAFRLQELHMGGCKSVDATSLLQLMCSTYLLKSLCLRDTSLVDDALYNFSGFFLERLDVSDTMISGAALAHIIRRNPGLKLLKARGCRNFCYQESNLEASALPYKVLSYSGCPEGDELHVELGSNCILEEVAFGWGFSCFSLENLGAAIRSLKAITVGLGASFGEYGLKLLPNFCPLLESVVLNFQAISDSVVINLVESLRHLQVLGLCYCLGDLSSLSFCLSMPNLRKLRLERVTPWMTNDDLVILTQNCRSLVELSLSGCVLLDSDSQHIISYGWPGLISIHLEDCGNVTLNGVSSLYDCKAIEDLSLRHNGCGIRRNFIYDASSKMPMLRKVALDLCDASEGGFDSPSQYSDRLFLSIVKIAKCKPQRCSFDLQNSESCRRPVHKESIVLEFNSKGLKTTVVKERV
ncbi:Leucine-rich repeat [Macleaya cordata]|uniref:Leucine-rich repeat n=1 Tax=Macleaya cordata TaxID=56857 RepID=A0A200PZG4_MACCD|nr:Leucine-rich repeat [Macleaya cordata]